MSKEKILLIEDSDSICTVYAHILQESGYFLKYATSGDEALGLLEKESFELVICDYWLPDTTGIDLLDEIKGKDKNIYSIMFTSSSIDHLEAKALSGGVDDFVLKPCKQDRLLLGVKRGMEIRRVRMYKDVINEKMSKLSSMTANNL